MNSSDNPDILPRQLYSTQQVKIGEVECAKQLGVSLYQLMERAGRAVFDTMLSHFNQTHSVLVVAGRGNNGGDAYVFARLALQAKWQVNVLAFAPDQALTGDAEIARQAYINQGMKIGNIETELTQELEKNSPDLIVDGLIGTGVQGAVKEKMAKVIEQINCSSVPVIAIDVPSGLNADTGEVISSCINAQYTVTFIATKLGLMLADGPDHSGHIIFSGLGIEQQFKQKYSPQACVFGLPAQVTMKARKRNTHKGKNGHVLCVGGAEGMPGAAFLAAKASLRTGAGKVSVLCHPSNVAIINTMCPELMVWGADTDNEDLLKQRVSDADVIMIGPGLGQTSWSQQLVYSVLRAAQVKPKPIIVDADGLNLLAKEPELAQLFIKFNGFKVITPHPLEAARLLDSKASKINKDRIKSGLRLAQKLQAEVILKGHDSLVISEQQVSINVTGNSGMASAGMGDVLTGIVAALLANNENLQFNLNERVKLAVYLHGLAGDFAAKSGEIGIIATDVIEQLPQAIQSCRR